MHTKTIISAAALAITLGFAGPAFAQAVTLGAHTVTEAEMPLVQTRCDELSAASTAASDGSTDTTANVPTPAGTTTEGDGEQGTEEGTAGLIELDTITLEQCVEAGLIAN
ncbi:hypothetical protein SAMN05428969_1651 [Devosia sp. YR412]|uniref:hypothetical protein n=1 Tax=Devosia sp. YR412 TaxID=1881030 RepID=UPI0008D24BDE|nr:hypothetical protein [Devosia sp. YR412]SEQ03756.1 hypothetical protein SAMN05428969_1651 [Devosia sp. YR412]